MFALLKNEKTVGIKYKSTILFYKLKPHDSKNAKLFLIY